MAFGIPTLNVCPKSSLFDPYQDDFFFHCDSITWISCYFEACVATLTTRPRQLHEAYGGQSTMGIRASTFTWLHWGESWCHEVKPARVLCSCGFHLVSHAVLTCQVAVLDCCPCWRSSNARRLRVTPKYTTWNTMYAFLPVYMLVCLYAFIYPATYPSMWLLTYLPSTYPFAWKFAQVLFCLVPIHPYIHDMSCHFKHDSRKRPQGSKIRKIRKTKKILTMTKDKKRMAEAPWHNMILLSLFLAVYVTVIPGVRRLRRVWTETPAAARLL